MEGRRGEVRRYQLRTAAPWRAALERLRALAPIIAASGLQLDRLDPAARRRIRDLARSVRTIGWACSTERMREHGLAPEAGDLDGWLRAGIVDAIAGRAPGRLDAEPDAHAYRQGHAAALLALYTTTPLWAAEEPAPMTPQSQEPTPTVDTERVIHIPAPLAAALVAAQRAANKLIRDEKGDKGKYTSADAIADEARRVLAEHGAAWVLVDSELAAPGLEQCDIGAQAYVGDIVERWIIVHESGAALAGSSRMPVIASKGRPHDKAMSASQTYGHGVALRGALCLAREGKNAIDKREDRDDGLPMRPRAQPSSKGDPLARERAELRRSIGQIVAGSSKPTDAGRVWAWVADQLGMPGIEIDHLDEESLAEARRFVSETAARKATYRKTEALHHGHRVTEHGEQSSPEHARLVARILGHAEALAGLREATVDEVMRAELRPDAAANLGGLALADLTGIEAALAGTLREESAP
jgi:hypothetical protein